MKILLHPQFKQLQSFVEHIEEHFAKGTSLLEERNSIRICSVGDLELNVKRFRKPRFFQRIIYSFFRKPKGLRAYEYPKYILKAGIETPQPVAYIEERKWGLLGQSYFISIQCPYRHRFYEFATVEMDEKNLLIAQKFAQMTAKLHEANLLHLDYSPGNILYDWIDGEPQFSLVDTNRMQFGQISIKEGCKNFARLWGQPAFFNAIAEEYAKARQASPEQCKKWILKARKKFWIRYRRRHNVPFPLVWK